MSPTTRTLRNSAGPRLLEADAHLGTLFSRGARWSPRSWKSLQMEAQLVIPYLTVAPFPCQRPPGPRKTYLSARQTLGSRLPLKVRKDRLRPNSQSLPAYWQTWSGVAHLPAQTQGSSPRRPRIREVGIRDQTKSRTEAIAVQVGHLRGRQSPVAWGMDGSGHLVHGSVGKGWVGKRKAGDSPGAPQHQFLEALALPKEAEGQSLA
jgi:hypothetical protein